MPTQRRRLAHGTPRIPDESLADTQWTAEMTGNLGQFAAPTLRRQRA